MLAPLDTVINTFGGRWFDEQWNAQLNSPRSKQAVNFYVDTVQAIRRSSGAVVNAVSTSARNLFGQGQTAMWYDATSRGLGARGPQELPGPGRARSATLPAPSVEKPNSGWLYTWALGIPEGGQEPGRRHGSSSPG